MIEIARPDPVAVEAPLGDGPRCALCGSEAEIERLMVYRPQQGPVEQVVTRCLRKAKKGERCRAQIAEKPVETPTEENEPDSHPTKICEAGCGTPIPEEKRFCSQQCRARHAAKFRRGGALYEPAPEAESNGPCRPANPEDLEQVFEALRYLRGLPREVRKKALELLETLENSAEPG